MFDRKCNYYLFVCLLHFTHDSLLIRLDLHFDSFPKNSGLSKYDLVSEFKNSKGLTISNLENLSSLDDENNNIHQQTNDLHNKRNEAYEHGSVTIHQLTKAFNSGNSLLIDFKEISQLRLLVEKCNVLLNKIKFYCPIRMTRRKNQNESLSIYRKKEQDKPVISDLVNLLEEEKAIDIFFPEEHSRINSTLISAQKWSSEYFKFGIKLKYLVIYQLKYIFYFTLKKKKKHLYLIRSRIRRSFEKCHESVQSSFA